jgi:hypothetical protein
MPDLDRIWELTNDIENIAEEIDDVATAYMGHEGEFQDLIDKLWDTARDVRLAIHAEGSHEEVSSDKEVSG